MFIIKFNKMIHNKLLWGAFATVVVLAFAASDIISGRREPNVRDGVGILDGQSVSYRDYELARLQIRMEQKGSQNEDVNSDEQVWQNLAALREAENLGTTVAEEEVMDILRRDPSFADPQGRFDPIQYRRVLENELGMTPETYQAIRHNQLLISKLERAVASAAWGVPSVAEEQGRGMTDQFTVRTVAISNNFETADVTLDDEELEAFYQERLPSYRVPERVSVRYVAFAAGKYLDRVEVDEDDARDYYDAHLDQYQVTTNGPPSTLAFEDVRTIVESELKLQKARELAEDAAANFADIFYYGEASRSDADDFERIATEQGLSVRTSSLFSAASPPVGIDASSEFVPRAFDLNPDSRRDRYSDAVAGRDASYVLAFHERREAHDPEFAEVEDRVRTEATEFNRSRLFAEYVDQVRGTVATEMDKDRAFDEVLSELGLQAGTNRVLTALDAFRSLPGGQTLATRMMRMSAGDVSPAVFVEKGAVFLQVVSREPGDELQQQVMTEQMARQLRNGISELVREDWKRYTLAKMNLVTSRRSTAMEAEADDAREP